LNTSDPEDEPFSRDASHGWQRMVGDLESVSLGWTNPTASEVVPGRREAASPEPITTALGVWIPGSRAAHAPRNDAHKDLLTQYLRRLLDHRLHRLKRIRRIDIDERPTIG